MTLRHWFTGRKHSKPKKQSARERGQTLVLTAMAGLVLLGITGFAIDYGRIFAARSDLTRAVDAAALAGAQELPNTTSAQSVAAAYLTRNDSQATARVTVDNTIRQVRVDGTRGVDMTFLKVVGFNHIDVSAYAIAGFGVIPVDVVLAIDSSGSMGSAERGCNSSKNNSGCPIKEAIDAGKAFVDVLLTGSTASSQTVIGSVPYRGCYNTPRNYSECPRNPSEIGALTNSNSTIKSKIDLARTVNNRNGTGTNICLPLTKAYEVITGAGSHSASNTHKFIVILSDGDNVMNPNARNSSQGAPPTACRPPSDNTELGSGCNPTESGEGDLDRKTYNYAQTLKNTYGIEIFVVGLGVCGSSSTALCNPGAIGTGHDNTQDRNLLKCLASSKANTNDHYLETDDPTQLTSIFQQIARTIAFRLVE